ncbi:MAG TPA: hypothetical protein VFI17_02725 [Solirubrobacterales bacterium]|nr:hypothetical protein [Solirubrobacterales bacterium]
MRKRNLASVLLATVAAVTVSASPALGSNASHPATYTGTAAGGGAIEFDVSADGSAVTRFAAKGIETTCGTVESTTTGSVAIVNDAFQYAPSSGLGFSGSFPSPQQAQGTVTLKLGFPFSCTSQPVSWTASTPTPPPVPPDTTPPNTKIKSGPSGKTSKEKATFRFTSTEGGSTFKCKLDRRKWSSCKSPKTYKGLGKGKHTFKVKATDAAGNVDSSPAVRSWRIEG